MKSIAEILKRKADNVVHTISPDAPVYDAIKLMADQSIGALVVVEHDTVVGILTERDYARKVVLKNRSSESTRVSEIMTRAVIYARPQDDNEACMALMTQRRLRHLPVMDNERLVGMISIGDLVKDMVQEQEFIIEQLERYIAGEKG